MGRLRLVCALVCVPVTASAFTIATGFSDPCHEDITTQAFLAAGFDVPAEAVQIPDGGTWRKVAAFIEERHDLPPAGDLERFLFHSLYVGVRSNDTNGHSALNLASLRAIHTNAAGQPDHCLRALEDDGIEGDVVAVTNCRTFILDQLKSAHAFMLLPPEERTITVEITLDFFGAVRVEVWAPAYYTGRALHTLQDSFTHTLRTDDLRRIRHVMNFVEPLGPDHDEARDGLPHSNALDTCDETEIAPLKEAATDASVEMLNAALKRITGTGPEAGVAVLDSWITYEAGCHIGNDYCQTKWLEIAKQDLTGPFLSCATGSRTASPLGPTFFLLLMGLGCVLGWRVRCRIRP